jgi:RimJ/RimL family protein N-acetyltransferase
MILGEGVGLRVPLAGDRRRWLELFRDPDQLRFGTPAVVPVPASFEELDERIATAGERFAERQPGTLVIVSVEEPERFLGTVGWSFHVPPPLRVADIGYSVHPDARGRGVARAAIRALTRWLTTDTDGPGLARVQLDHSVENAASCRTALAAGFAREGIRRGFLPLRDADAPDGVRRHDVCLHGMVASP